MALEAPEPEPDPWFNVIGITRPVVLDPALDNTAFVSLPVAERVFQLPPNPSEIYVRANINQVTQVSNLLAASADPQNADGVQVSRPSDVLEARAAAKDQRPLPSLSNLDNA